MTQEESKEDPSELIYDLPECFMMTWEELMDGTSTTTTGYDIWNEEILELENNQTLTNGGRHFKPQSSYSTPTNGGRHLKPQVNSQTPINWGRHFKPPHLETENSVEALNKSTQQIPTEEEEVLKQLQKTQANISL